MTSRTWIPIIDGDHPQPAGEDGPIATTCSEDPEAPDLLQISISQAGLWREAPSVDDARFVRLVTTAGGALTEPGKPRIPTLGLLVALPKNIIDDDVTVQIGEAHWRAYPDAALLEPAAAPLPLADAQGEPDLDPLYASDETYPAWQATAGGVRSIMGVKVLEVMIALVRCQPGLRKIELLERMELAVTVPLREGAGPEGYPRRPPGLPGHVLNLEALVTGR
ncbi:MAG: hypothetical protein ABIK09_05910 [Pseudomonadota bacterium]